MGYFTSAHLKIKWADKHIADLQAVFSRFLQTDFYRLGVDRDPDGRNVLRFESTVAVPWETPLLIGDAVHNLRSALDHVAHAIVADAGLTPSRRVSFPFAQDRQELISTLRNGEIEAAAGQTLIDLIVDTVRPYKGGNDALYAIHALDIVDKHKLLIPVISVIGLHGVSGRGGGVTMQNCSFGVSEGGVLNAISIPGPFEITDHGQPMFEVRFDQGQALEGQPVLPTLHQLSQLVAGVVETIEKSYSPPT